MSEFGLPLVCLWSGFGLRLIQMLNPNVKKIRHLSPTTNPPFPPQLKKMTPRSHLSNLPAGDLNHARQRLDTPPPDCSPHPRKYLWIRGTWTTRKTSPLWQICAITPRKNYKKTTITTWASSNRDTPHPPQNLVRVQVPPGVQEKKHGFCRAFLFFTLFFERIKKKHLQPAIRHRKPRRHIYTIYIIA